MAGIAASDADVVALLMRQHGDIRNLFDKVERTTGDERRTAFRSSPLPGRHRHAIGPLTVDPSGANEWWKVNACGAEPWSWRCSSLETPSCQVGITPSETHQNT